MKINKKILVMCLTFIMSLMLCLPAFAAEAVGDAPVQTEEAGLSQAEAVKLDASEASSDSIVLSDIGAKSVAAGIAIGLAAIGGTIAMGMATGKASESMARQPEIQSNIRTTLMLGLVFIETAIIYALLVVILIIFVL